MSRNDALLIAFSSLSAPWPPNIDKRMAPP
jgi:hypothetical protein